MAEEKPRGPISCNMTQEDIAHINAIVGKNMSQLFRIPSVLQHITATRIDRLKPEDINGFYDHGDGVSENTVDYNIEGIKGKWALHRPMLLANILTSCDWITLNAGSADLLTIGPRTEAELFYLVAVGFNSLKIRALDLVSYSPFVDLGDMHDMPYDDNSFDVVILGWVLAYSNDNKKAADEVIRVARPGAFIAIGCEYSPLNKEEITELLAKDNLSKGSGTRFDSTEEILSLFEGNVERVIFRHDVHPDMRDQTGSIMTVFRLK